MSQQHMMVSFKVTSAGEDNKESWAEHESTLSANSLPLSWAVCGSSGRIMTFYLLSSEGGFCFENIFSYRTVIVSWNQFYKPYFLKCSTSRLLFFTYNGDKSNNYGVH